MAIKLSANYSKKLGLPQFSSHSFSASVEIELSDISQVEEEIQKLYQLLQHSVDQEIQHPGFVPQQTNGQKPTNGRTYQLNGHPQPKATGDAWNCTEGQRGFILRILNENQIEKQEAENLSLQLFNMGVKQLNKMQASQLIEELLTKAGKPSRQARWSKPPTTRAA
jgi:hypothetical protein